MSKKTPNASSQDETATAESSERALRGALAEVVRRSRLPITPKVNGLPSSEAECAAAIAKCARLAVEHIAEPAAALVDPVNAEKKEG